MALADQKLDTMPFVDGVRSLLGVDTAGNPALSNLPAYVLPYAGTGIVGAEEILSAVDTVKLRGAGTVILPENLNYELDGKVLVPSNVNLRGGSRGARGSLGTNGGVNIVCTTADAQIAFGDLTASSYGGRSGGFTLHGNNTAETPLYVGRSVQRTFEDIMVMYAAGDAVVIQEAQNNLFNRLDVELNGGSGVVFDRGCGANVLMLPEITYNGEYNVKYVQSDASPAVYARPSDNLIIGGNIERTVPGCLGTIYHGAGTRNRIIGTAISASDPTSDFSMIVMRKDGAQPSDEFVLDNVQLSGVQAYTTAFDLRGSVQLILSGRVAPQLHKALFAMDDSAQVRVVGGFGFASSNITSYFVNLDGGTRLASDLIRVKIRATEEVESLASSDIMRTHFVSGDTKNRFELRTSGEMRFGPGNAETDVNVFRGNPDGTAGLTISAPIRVSGRPEALHFTSGSPGLGLGQDGHIAIDVAGSAGAFIYKKVAGAWAAVL